MDGLCLKTGIHGVPTSISVNGNLVEARAVTSHISAKSTVAASGSAQPQKAAASRFFSFRYPLQSLWPRGEKSSRYNKLAIDDVVLEETGTAASDAGSGVGADREEEDGNDRTMESPEVHNGNWVLKILHVTSIWKGKRENIEANVAAVDGGDCDEDTEGEGECESCKVGDLEIEIDKESFSKLLRRVSLSEARLYAKMSYLGNLAYTIPKITSENLLKRYGLHYVTSSIDHREMLINMEKDKVSAGDKEAEEKNLKETIESKQQKNNGYRISASAAYHIAASAASYLHSHTKSMLPFKGTSGEPGVKSLEGGSGSNENGDMTSDMASLRATTDSVTAVVAAKEEVKQAVADDLNSTRSSPCEWYICDDDHHTRYLVIQGSESLASWKANLLFEPIQFEELDVVVHRGIYEAAKGIYEQMLPEVRAHLKSHGSHATFRFTGHSLGGSLSLLINLMLLVRGEVPASSLLPVITFGAPSIMCGGDDLLRKLGLPRNHVQAITMHRDIVPRAFCCNYPTQVAELLKAVNRNFRNHHCLNRQKMLYAPMGELLILQPDEKYSPEHHLLPSGNGLYLLSCPVSDALEAEKQLWAARTLFLNSPHPLEILSDRSAYGSDGSIKRHHDVNSYVKCVRNVIQQELNQIRKSRREHRRKFWWSILSSHGANVGVLIGRLENSVNMGQTQFNFSGIMHTGRESLKRFSRLVASQHMHLLVVLLFPARMLLMGAYSVINFH